MPRITNGAKFTMTVLNTFLAISGWVWTVIVLFFAAGYFVGYKAALRERSQAGP